jgi:mannose-6-phosphate isomerase-like protein (cupin superfamily)
LGEIAVFKEALIVNVENNADYQSILDGHPQTCGMRSGRIYLGTGQACGLHSTNAHEEILVFLSGQGEALIGDKDSRHRVGKGKVLYIPPHTPHDIRNSGIEPLVYIYCVAPIRQG